MTNRTVLVHSAGNRLLGLVQTGQEDQNEENLRTYTFDVWSYSYTTPSTITHIDSDAVSYAAVVPLELLPEYVYVNENYLAIVFGSLPVEGVFQLACLAFSRADGRVIAKFQFSDNSKDMLSCFAFGANRIFIAKGKTLYAVEVTP